MDLDNLKYSELQKLAKNAGIRANQKIDKLVKALKGYYGSHAEGTTSKTKPTNDDVKQILDVQTSTTNKTMTVKSAVLKQNRNSTFELEEATLGVPATPEVEKTTKKTHLTGTPVTQNVSSNSSPGIQDMLDSMAGVISSAERRKRLMSAIDKKIETKVKHSPHAGPTQIPRFAAFLVKRKQEQKKPITPGNKDWEKLHKKEFSKFDSIDVYLEKKRKRAEEMTASVKKTRTVLHEVQEAVTKLRSKRSPYQGKGNPPQPFKPSVFSTKNMNLNFGTASSTKTPDNRNSGAVSKSFRPPVTSTKDMNVNFSSVKTPITAEMSQHIITSNDGSPFARKSVRASQMSARKSLGASAARKSSGNTPFHFTGNLNTSDARSVSKPVFDLKASLARPITWKPHFGKLKPINAHYKNFEGSIGKPAAVNRVDIFKSAVNKTRITYSRQDRRAVAAAKRAEKKNNQQMKRRGITAVS